MHSEEDRFPRNGLYPRKVQVRDTGEGLGLGLGLKESTELR